MIFESWYYCHKSVVEAVLWFNNITDRRVYRGSKYDVFVFRLTCSQQLFPSIFAFHYLYIDYVCTPPGNFCIPLRLWHVTQSTASGHIAAVDPHTDILGTESRLQISPHFPTPSRLSVSSCTRYCLLSAVCSCLLPKTSTTTLHSCRHSIIISAHSVYANLWEESFNHSHCNVWN